LNEADNFDILYYKLYKGKTLKKGVISCGGYRVEMFEESEEDEFGKYGFKLVPNDETRRCWWFRAEDDEMKKEWEEVSAILLCRRLTLWLDLFKCLSSRASRAMQCPNHSELI
jgi:hypothetical protein